MAARTSVDTLAAGRAASPADPAAARQSLRLTVVGDTGRADLVAPPGIDVATLARTYGDQVGAAVPSLRTAAGSELPADRSLAECGLRHGDLLVAVAEQAGPGPTDRRAHQRGSGGGSLPRQLPVVVLTAAAGCGLVAAGLVGTGAGAGSATRMVCLLVLVCCAVVAASPLAAGNVRARATAGPAFAAAAGFVAADASGPGGLLLALAVAALCAAVTAAVARAFLDDDPSDLLVVWLAVGSTGAVLSVALLLAGGSVQALFAVPFAAGVVAVRLLPAVVLDVPDEALLDLDRLAVTAWSARDRPRGTRRRRSVVRATGVQAVVRRGKRLVAAGTVAAAVAVAVTGPLLVMAPGDDVVRIGSRVMVGLGGVALALVARSFRSALPRLVVRCSAAWVLLVLGGGLLAGSGGPRLLWEFAGLFAAAALTCLCAVLLGRGWRSLWWARVADVTEALAVVLVVALVPIACAGFDAIRGFMS